MRTWNGLHAKGIPFSIYLFFFQLLIEVEFHDIDDWFIHKFSSFTTRNRDNELYEQIKCLITYVRKYTVLVY